MFIDVAEIYVCAGKGGDGHVSFHRAKYIPNGGPDGGDGGRGGDAIFVADPNMASLQDFRHKRKYKAENGESGGQNKNWSFRRKSCDSSSVGTLLLTKTATAC